MSHFPLVLQYVYECSNKINENGVGEEEGASFGVKERREIAGQIRDGWKRQSVC